MLEIVKPALQEVQDQVPKAEQDTFKVFWENYPRKIAKLDAQKSWKKLSTAKQQLALEALKSHIKLWRSEERETKHIPYPATWLNGERWEDEIEIPTEIVPACVGCGCRLDGGYVQTGEGKMCHGCKYK